jgi:hypothetical protein
MLQDVFFRSMSFLPLCTTMADACHSYKEHGAAVLACPSGNDEFVDAVAGLFRWCQEADRYMDNHPEHLKKLTRSDDPAETSLRYSLNDHWNQTYPEWQEMLAQVDKHVGNVICEIFSRRGRRSSYDVSCVGGDVVRPKCMIGQLLHGDGYSVRPEPADAGWCQYMVASIAVHKVDSQNAPLFFAGKQAMMSHFSNAPPECCSDLGIEAGKCLVHMEPGDILIRDPRVWHCGTPNYTDTTRYLPGIQFASCEAVAP